ncbi:hypothetical protein [Anaerobiospirillum sp. NML120449]|uniref:hypothetical protein n=1 Tax=Anaerobiospirillum sp. NML120449 TaxID=2932817 RepID=UPI001FF49C41|nr:hypothetical protein [Anaerobiospirillum sp. NML120449]MCK0526398.1 hypothetical protein [Anaerobiospirillum sp. NML120449]
MAMTLVQQCKAWFEASEDDRIIAAVVQSDGGKGRVADSSVAVAMPPGPERQQRIDALFWLGAATCRKAIRSSDRDLLRSGVRVLLPLYGDYCDDLNYFVSLALSFDYLGEHEQALMYLYEALAQFPAVAHIDDMIADSARALNVSDLQALHSAGFISWHSRCRKAWLDLLQERERLEHMASEAGSGGPDLDGMQRTISSIVSSLSRTLTCSVSMSGEYINVIIGSVGHDSMLLPIKHFLALMPRPFAGGWRFITGEPALDHACISSDGLTFGTEECWCSLEPARTLPVWLGTTPDLNSATGTAGVPGPQAGTDEAIARANLTNNLGQKKTKFSHSSAAAGSQAAARSAAQAPSAAGGSQDSTVGCNAGASQGAVAEAGAASAATAAAEDPLAGLDPDLFPDLFDDDFDNEPGTDGSASCSEGQLRLNAAVDSALVSTTGLRRLHVDIYHPMLYTWFKASRSQHPQVLDRMLRRLLACAAGELNILTYVDSVALVQSRPELAYRLDMLPLPLKAMGIEPVDSDAAAQSTRWFYYSGWNSDLSKPGLTAPQAALRRGEAIAPGAGQLSAINGPQREGMAATCSKDSCHDSCRDCSPEHHLSSTPDSNAGSDSDPGMAVAAAAAPGSQSAGQDHSAPGDLSAPAGNGTQDSAQGVACKGSGLPAEHGCAQHSTASVGSKAGADSRADSPAAMAQSNGGCGSGAQHDGARGCDSSASERPGPLVFDPHAWLTVPSSDLNKCTEPCPDLRADIIEGVSCLRDLMLELNSASVDAQAIDLMSAGVVPLTVALPVSSCARLLSVLLENCTDAAPDAAAGAAPQAASARPGSAAAAGRASASASATGSDLSGQCSAIIEACAQGQMPEGTAGLECLGRLSRELTCHLKSSDSAFVMSVTGWAVGREYCYLDVLSCDLDLTIDALCQWLEQLVLKQTGAAPAQDNGQLRTLYVQPMVKGSMVSKVHFTTRVRV